MEATDENTLPDNEETTVSDNEETILEVRDWMEASKITLVTCKGSGGGDEGHLDEFSFFRGDNEVDLNIHEKEGFSELEDRLVESLFDLAYWETSDNEGGDVTLEIHQDGRYRLTGGWFGGYTEADPLFGSVTSVEWSDDELSASPAELTFTGEDIKTVHGIFMVYLENRAASEGSRDLPADLDRLCKMVEAAKEASP